MLHRPPTNLLLLAAKQESHKKAYLLMKNIEEFLGKVQKKGPTGRKRSDRKGNRTMQKNKRGDIKVESNDSTETQDREETSDILGLPSGAHTQTHAHTYTCGRGVCLLICRFEKISFQCFLKRKYGW